MRKLSIIGLSLVLLLFAACSKDDGDAAEEGNNQDESSELDEEESEEENENDVDEDADGDMDEEEEEEEEPTFADEVNVFELSSILLDQEEVDGFDEDTLVEHEQTLYIESEFITTLLDYELVFDADNGVVELYEEKGDFVYEPNHSENNGDVLTVGEFYIESIDDYVNPDDKYNYDFIELNDKLYVPERFVTRYLGEPINYHRRDSVLELGIQSEVTYLADVETDGNMLWGDGGVSSDPKHTTIKGTKYDSVAHKYDSRGIETLHIIPRSEFSQVDGIVYNKTDEHEIEVTGYDANEKELFTATVGKNDIYEFSLDIKGEELVTIKYQDKSKALIPGTTDAVIYAEFK